MCHIHNGLYQLSYEIDEGRIFAPGEPKDITLNMTNCTGSRKYVVDIVIESDSNDVGLRGHGQPTPRERVEHSVRLPPAYWRPGQQMRTAFQTAWRVEVNIRKDVSVPMETTLRGAIRVRPSIVVSDPDGGSPLVDRPFEHSFDPPVVVR